MGKTSNRTSRAFRWVLVGSTTLALGAAAGCELIVGFDYGLIGEGGGGGVPVGGGGSGGEGATTTMGTGASGGTTTGGGGQGGSGGCVPEDDLSDCTDDVCNPDGTTAHNPAPAGTLCDDGGGTVCDDLGNCLPTCTDGVQNGEETDIDCGGSACPPCLLPNGAACAAAGACQSAFCVDGVCCEAACTGLCAACTMAKTGQANGTCANVTNNTDPDNECAGAATCTGGACSKLPLGSPCTMPTECTLGFCADGVCCNADCLGNCRACDGSSGGAVGACTFYGANQDPMDMECPGPTSCSGVGQCLKVAGAACMNNAECISNNCSAMVCQ